jgi:hypothetical protein
VHRRFTQSLPFCIAMQWDRRACAGAGMPCSFARMCVTSAGARSNCMVEHMCVPVHRLMRGVPAPTHTRAPLTGHEASGVHLRFTQRQARMCAHVHQGSRGANSLAKATCTVQTNVSFLWDLPMQGDNRYGLPRGLFLFCRHCCSC